MNFGFHSVITTKYSLTFQPNFPEKMESSIQNKYKLEVHRFNFYSSYKSDEQT